MHIVNSLIERELHACKASQSSRITELQSLKHLIDFYSDNQAKINNKLAFKIEYLVNRSLEKLAIAHKSASEHIFTTFSSLIQDLHDKYLIDLDALARYSLKITSQNLNNTTDSHAPELILSIHETWSPAADHLISELAVESATKASFKQINDLLKLEASRELLKIRISSDLNVVEHLANEDRLGQSYLIFIIYKCESTPHGISLQTPVKYSILNFNRASCNLSASYDLKFNPVAFNSRSDEEVFAKLSHSKDNSGFSRQLSARRFKTLIFTRKSANLDRQPPDSDKDCNVVSINIQIFNNYNLISNFERLFFKQNSNFINYLSHLSQLIDKSGCETASIIEPIRIQCSFNDANEIYKRNFVLKISLLDKLTKSIVKQCMIPMINFEYYIKNSIDICDDNEKCMKEVSVKLSFYEISNGERMELIKELEMDIEQHDLYINGDKIGLFNIKGIAIQLPMSLKCVKTIALLDNNINSKLKVEEIVMNLGNLASFKLNCDSKIVVKPLIEAIFSVNDREISNREEKVSLIHTLFNALIKILSNTPSGSQMEALEMGANNLKAIKTILKLVREYFENSYQLIELVKALNSLFEIVIAIYRRLNLVNLELKYEIKLIMRATMRALASDSTLVDHLNLNFLNLLLRFSFFSSPEDLMATLTSSTDQSDASISLNSINYLINSNLKHFESNSQFQCLLLNYLLNLNFNTSTSNFNLLSYEFEQKVKLIRNIFKFNNQYLTVNAIKMTLAMLIDELYANFSENSTNYYDLAFLLADYINFMIKTNNSSLLKLIDLKKLFQTLMQFHKKFQTHCKYKFLSSFRYNLEENFWPCVVNFFNSNYLIRCVKISLIENCESKENITAILCSYLKLLFELSFSKESEKFDLELFEFIRIVCKEFCNSLEANFYEILFVNLSNYFQSSFESAFGLIAFVINGQCSKSFIGNSGFGESFLNFDLVKILVAFTIMKKSKKMNKSYVLRLHHNKNSHLIAIRKNFDCNISVDKTHWSLSSDFKELIALCVSINQLGESEKSGMLIEKKLMVENLLNMINNVSIEAKKFELINEFKLNLQLHLIKHLIKLNKKERNFLQVAFLLKEKVSLVENSYLVHMEPAHCVSYKQMIEIYFLDSLKYFSLMLLSNQILDSYHNLNGNFNNLIQSGFFQFYKNLFRNSKYLNLAVVMQAKFNDLMNEANRNLVEKQQCFMVYRIGFFGANFFSNVSLNNKYYLHFAKCNTNNHQLLTKLKSDFNKKNIVLLNYNYVPSEEIKSHSSNSYLQICLLSFIDKVSLVKLINLLHDGEKSFILNERLRNYDDSYLFFYYDRPFYAKKKLDFNGNSFNGNRISVQSTNSSLGDDLEASQEDSIERLWLERNILLINDRNMLNEFIEIEEILKLSLNPVLNAINDITEKLNELREFIKEFTMNIDVSAKFNLMKSLQPLTMRLIGCLDAPINGGLRVYIKKLLNQSFLSSLFADDKARINYFSQKLYFCIKEQLNILASGLTIHGRLLNESDAGNSDNQAFIKFKSLNNKFENMKQLNEHLINCYKSIENELNQNWMEISSL